MTRVGSYIVLVTLGIQGRDAPDVYAIFMSPNKIVGSISGLSPQRSIHDFIS